MNTLANQTVAAQPNDVGVKKSDRQKWKPKLDSTEWGIVNYIVDKNQGTAITSSCNMFFKKSKGRTLFGIYSTDDSTLLYASRERTAERECLFLEQFLKEYENGNVTDTSAEGLRTWAKTVRMQQNASTGDDSTYVAPGRFEGNAELHGRPSGLYASAALRNVLENIFKEEAAGRTGDGRVRKSDRNSDRDTKGRQLTRGQQEFFKDSVVRDEDGNLMVMYHGTSRGGHTIFDPWGKSNYGLFGTGSYFTDSKSIADAYTNKGKGNNKQVYEIKR